MSIIEPNAIITIIHELNSQNFKYILLRNIGNEIPHSLKVKKDIDILIDNKEFKELSEFFLKKGYKRIHHPFDKYTYLYNTPPHLFFYNEKNGIKFDICFDICVKSLDFNNNKIIPLHKDIQSSAWRNRRKVKKQDFEYYALSEEDELISLVSRAIFDKKNFTQEYQENIKSLLHCIDNKTCQDKLYLVFYKFVPHLISLLKDNEFQIIYKKYLSFRSY